MIGSCQSSKTLCILEQINYWVFPTTLRDSVSISLVSLFTVLVEVIMPLSLNINFSDVDLHLSCEQRGLSYPHEEMFLHGEGRLQLHSQGNSRVFV